MVVEAEVVMAGGVLTVTITGVRLDSQAPSNSETHSVSVVLTDVP